MSEPVIAQRQPCSVEVKAGKEYYWCVCGKSQSQPFCDGSHSGTDFAPMPFRAEQDGTLWFCGCKHTKTAPFCDGSHSKLPE